MPMKTNAKRIAALALLAAVSFVLVFLSAIAPTLRLALLAAAGLPAAAAVLLYRTRDGFLVYAVSGLLALLFLPFKATAILFALFFGCYPVLKSLIERRRSLPIEWLLKLLFFNAILTILVLFFGALLTEVLTEGVLLPILYLAGNAVFAVYDIGLTGLLSVLQKQLKRLNL
ncbi:hypothetical protein LJC34_03905 [Oscillospiraceae bacterium OttesenSCG-928-G22]|nr:hypothetical protein [Oscillospiraceae bacterium OttesenSCG-928-G22]